MQRRAAATPTRRFRRLTIRVRVEMLSKAGCSTEIATTLGAGGLFIQTETPLPRDEELELRFRLPGSEQLHELRGRVVWANPPAAPGSDAAVPGHSPGMGIEFLERSASTALARALDKVSRTSLEVRP